jgi:chromosome segregation ATPase
MSDTSTNKNAFLDGGDPGTNRVPWVTIVLGAGLALCLGAALYLHNSLVNTRLETASLVKEVGALRQTVSNADQSVAQSLGAMKTEMENTRKASATSSQEATAAARRQAEAIASKLSTDFSRKQAEQQAQQKQLTSELGEVKTRTETATARLTDITTEVTSVKAEVANHKIEIDKTIAELRRTTGDMGVMSGLIATNSKELAALKELGERDYFEFTLSKSDQLRKVGDIQVQLRKADLKKNRFTLNVVAEDKKVEKRDRNINEPVQFYVPSKARQPYELVVNEVKKDQIVGYLSVPKLKTPGRRL